MIILRAEHAGRKTSSKTGSLHAIDKHHALFVVDFGEAHLDNFAVAGLYRPANVLRFDRHFSVPAVDQHAQRDALRPPQVKQAIHGGADRPAGVKDVIDQHEIHAVHGEIDVRGLQHGLWRDFGQVVAIQGDVENADGNFDPIDTAHCSRNSFGQGHAAPAYTDEGKIARAATFFDDLMGEALQSAVNFRRGHQLTFFNDSHDGVNANTTEQWAKCAGLPLYQGEKWPVINCAGKQENLR